jgi:hypothetical protein
MYVTDCVWIGWAMKIRAVNMAIKGIVEFENRGNCWFGTFDACLNMKIERK